MSQNYDVHRFYDHDDRYKDSFITWRRNMAIMYKFCTPEAKALFLDKVKWNKRFAPYVKRDWLYLKEADTEAVKAFLARHDEVIVKDNEGACGQGVNKYRSADILHNSDSLARLIGSDALMEEVAVNAEALRRFSPSSLNTLRFVTVIDRHGVPHIITTAFRTGDGRGHTDNIGGNGMACSVDTETGIVNGDALTLSGEVLTHHPATGLRFRGFQMPRWEEAKRLVIEIAKEKPEARFVGWDVVITEEGIDILEGNIPPDENLTQIDNIGRYRRVMDMY